MTDIPSLVYKYMESTIKRVPCHTNRASYLGYCVPELGGCIRRGVFKRTAWDKEELIDVKLSLIFREGNESERAVLRLLAESGVNIIQQQSMFSWDKYQITGSVDGAIIEDGIAIPIELKSSSPNIFAGITDLESLNKKPWTKVYALQLCLYELMKGVDQGILVFTNKSTFEMKQLEVPLNYELAEWGIKAAEAINKHIAAGTLPDKITDIEVCKQCSFKTLCQTDIKWDNELKIADDPDFVSRLDAYKRGEEAASETKALYEIIRERCKASMVNGQLNMIAGRWKLTGKTDTRGALRLTIEAV